MQLPGDIFLQGELKRNLVALYRITTSVLVTSARIDLEVCGRKHATAESLEEHPVCDVRERPLYGVHSPSITLNAAERT